VAHLAESGWDVVVFDLAKPNQDVIYVPVDLTQYGQVLDAMMGVEERYEQVDAVVHPRGHPSAGQSSESHHFRQQYERDMERDQCGSTGGSDQHRLGLQ